MYISPPPKRLAGGELPDFLIIGGSENIIDLDQQLYALERPATPRES